MYCRFHPIRCFIRHLVNPVKLKVRRRSIRSDTLLSMRSNLQISRRQVAIAKKKKCQHVSRVILKTDPRQFDASSPGDPTKTFYVLKRHDADTYNVVSGMCVHIKFKVKSATKFNAFRLYTLTYVPAYTKYPRFILPECLACKARIILRLHKQGWFNYMYACMYVYTHLVYILNLHK